MLVGRDVKIDLQSNLCLPYQQTDVSSSLNYMNFGIAKSKHNDTNIDEFGNHQLKTHHSSFTARMSNAECEIEETQNLLKNNLLYQICTWNGQRLGCLQ